MADDFMPLGGDEQQFGYDTTQPPPDNSVHPSRQQQINHRTPNPKFNRLNAQDRPKSKHILPGHEPWILVKTKLGRRFVHNAQTKESLWRIPQDLKEAVYDAEEYEKEREEKEKNAKWAEEELQKMRKPEAVVDDGRARRRRSESLQREDEEAMMAELAVEAESKEEEGKKSMVKTLEPEVGDVGYDSEGSYEYVEVTDDEGVEKPDVVEEDGGEAGQDQPMEDAGPVEFGEDDIAYQLAAMGQDYGLDPEDYGGDGEGDDNEDWPGDEDVAGGLAISAEEAANLFRDLLDDYQISPFTPWDKLISDESPSSILNDDRYTVLPTTRARKEVWDIWVRDKAAELKEARAKMEKLDPRIPYLAFLHEKATPKLYWPEFKRKYKKDAVMNDRHFADKDREKLYRDYINRLKLPESSRKADFISLLKSVPLRELNRGTSVDGLPQKVVSHLHYISLPVTVRDTLITAHIAGLPSASKEGDEEDELSAEEERKQIERRKREDALAERQRKVDAERDQREKAERFARRELREGEREVERAMAVPGRVRG
ncbi:hypothetical protein LTR56_010774 [Elasticomyces elasticus]|nr:hypothetical protein LTR56_010774 [Elasticomyces elasticus]KAK3667799.1 hypothetical protein LTR22_001244 [Elasticomyces elasticus]KAK4932208.1 hypothetical protein LTR49_001505 [Elasticomyces elasticus]KAK5763412.1 hypothetical protein LTS12_006383 [Elasticomyces elasticus]